MPTQTGTTALGGGFSDPARQSAHAFRALMEAMARTGTIHAVPGATPPAPLSGAAGIAILTLCDIDTPLYLAGAADCTAVRDWVAFQTGAPICAPGDAAFALGTWRDLGPCDKYPVGTAQYPDRSTTLIVEVPTLTPSGSTLRGPGIQHMAQLSLPETAAFQANRALFPRGLDFLFTCGDHLAALPRTTEVR
ncbi:phosphonate C-P lyase system protein PhnH [Tropicimonas sp. S265A]|uniref:phosphonate C-P lyase system protein PhnH n=1 Tax=Tropicimonas sp. S265A TaxID=3415134 RepID=UPI003C7D7A73